MNEVSNLHAPQRFSLRARAKSFAYAVEGVAFMLRTQHNAWVHALATVAVIALALYCDVSAGDWRWLVMSMAMVWVGETVNTAIEYVCDLLSPEYHLAVKHAKDIAAGGVLIAAVAATVIGVLTFWPYFT